MGKKRDDGFGFDKVYLQETKVRHWIRGDKEIANVKSKISGNHNLTIVHWELQLVLVKMELRAT